MICSPEVIQVPMVSATAGAAAYLTMADTLLPLPQPVHWAVAGVVSSSLCGTMGGSLGLNKQTAKAALGGIAGGASVVMLMQLVPF